MAINIDNDGNITMVQGDSGTIVVCGLNTQKNYKVYFAIQDKDRKTIGKELFVNSNKLSSVVFELTGDYTDLMTVPKNKAFEIYYFGIKICLENGIEETVSINNSDIGNLNTITVFPKKVEGIKL